ncbi:hypothetical protein BLOT_010789, partial [Blomia tropicalis]
MVGLAKSNNGFNIEKSHDKFDEICNALIRSLNNKKYSNNVISNDRVRIKSDIPILTENRIENNKPDLMIHDLKSNEITIIEVGITNKRILPSVETTKGRKYKDLAGDLKLMFRPAKITLIPIVLTWDGLVTRHFSRYMRQLGISERLQAYIKQRFLSAHVRASS